MRGRLLVPWRWPAWLWCSFVAIGLGLRFPLHFLDSPPYLMDFEVYRAVAERLVQGGAVQLYDATTSELMLFKYAPLWALVWLPLAWVPAHAGAILWMTCTTGWFLLAYGGATRLCRSASLTVPPWTIALVVGLLDRSLRAEFLNGQVDLLWATLTIGFFLAVVTHRYWWAACALASAMSLKLPAAIFLCYLTLRRRWRLAGQTLLLFGALNAAACLWLSPHHPLQLVRRWLSVLWSSGASRAFEIGNQSLLALAGRFLSADGYRLNVVSLPHTRVVLVVLLISAWLLGLVMARARRPVSEAQQITFDGALLTVVMVLCSPTVWVATYSALLFPVTLAIACLATRPQRTWSHWPSAMAAIGVVLCSLLTHSSAWRAIGLPHVRGESYVFLVFMVLPWLGLLLFSYLWRQRQVFRGST